MTFLEIIENIDVGTNEQCWPWKCFRDRWGYGRVWFEGRVWGVHRLIHRFESGEEIPDGLFVLHSCDNPICANPHHLRLGTHGENMADMVERGRVAAGEKHGSAKLTLEQVQAIRASDKTQRVLAKEFGVSRQLIGLIKSGEKWKVPAPARAIVATREVSQ